MKDYLIVIGAILVLGLADTIANGGAAVLTWVFGG